MSLLIVLAQRIKVIQSIQKTARAMQLISMSTLSRLKAQRPYVQHCADELERLVAKKPLDPTSTPLYVLISSQKGFSGNFDQLVFELFKQHSTSSHISVIAVGKSAEQFLFERHYNIVQKFKSFSPTGLALAAQNLADCILSYAPLHEQVYMVSNISLSIFLQKPQVTVLPLGENLQLQPGYALEQDKVIVEKEVFAYKFFVQIYTLLLESLIAENSARTISMESSNTNARTMLQKMKLDYNKLRQAKVTRELTELSSATLEH